MSVFHNLVCSQGDSTLIVTTAREKLLPLWFCNSALSSDVYPLKKKSMSLALEETWVVGVLLWVCRLLSHASAPLPAPLSWRHRDFSTWLWAHHRCGSHACRSQGDVVNAGSNYVYDSRQSWDCVKLPKKGGSCYMSQPIVAMREGSPHCGNRP